MQHPQVDSQVRWSDLCWIALFIALLIGAGLGLRDPWPADEPRFASLARDMVASGDWLIPRVGGDLYQDKPPVFFWLLALAYATIGSVRWSFLLPSVLASTGTLWLVYSLATRLHGRRARLAAHRRAACARAGVGASTLNAACQPGWRVIAHSSVSFGKKMSMCSSTASMPPAQHSLGS